MQRSRLKGDAIAVGAGLVTALLAWPAVLALGVRPNVAPVFVMLSVMGVSVFASHVVAGTRSPRNAALVALVSMAFGALLIAGAVALGRSLGP